MMPDPSADDRPIHPFTISRIRDVLFEPQGDPRRTLESPPISASLDCDSSAWVGGRLVLLVGGGRWACDPCR